jgi:general secretion pathway protein D
VTRQQAYDQLLTALRLQGFTIVQTGNVARVVPEADAKLQGGAVIIPKGSAPSGDQLVTQVFRLQYESATAMVPILRPLIAPNNTISAYPQNNTLVITDYADNLRRIQRIIESIDTPATSDVEIIAVKNGLALEIATVVNRVLDEGARAAGQATDAGQRISLLAEPRTNSIIIRAPSPQRLQLAKSLIAQLDKPALTPGNINVIHLRNAEAVRLAPLLRAIIGADASFVPQGTGGSGLSPTTSMAPGSSPQLGTTLGTSVGTAPGVGQIAGGGAGGGGAGGLAGMIQADPATNSLIITAPEVLYRNIRAIVDKLDTRRAQVVIESLIVEVTADKAAEFGIQWQALGGIDNSGTNVIGGTNFGVGGNNIINAAQNIGSLGQGLNLGVVRGRVNIPGIGEVLNLAFLARALATSADANILSTPTIQTLDNEEAKFLVGQNIPLITGSFTATGGAGAVNPFQTFERRDIGLQLRVKPQISEGGVVRLAIYQELSSIQNTLTAAQGGIITNKRSFESSVLVEDGNIVVLGGLIEDRVDNSKSSVPVLGDIPIVGGLFRYENRGRRKTNLLVFLRPYVVRDESTSSSLALDRYDYIRGQVAAGTLPDTMIFRDLQGRQLPPTPPVPPTMRRQQESGTGAPADAPAPTPGAEPAPMPPQPAAPPEPRPAPAPVAPTSAAPAPPVVSAPVAPPAVVVSPPVAPPPVAVPPVASPPVASPPVASPPMATPRAEPTPVARAPEAAPSPRTERSTQPPAPIIDVPPPIEAEPVSAPTISAAAAPSVAAPIASAPMPTPVPTTPAPQPMASAPPPSSSAAAAVAGTAAPTTSRVGSGTPARPGTTQAGSTLLQVAAVSDIARGRELQRQLHAAGMDAYWESVRTKQGTDIVRVRVTVDPATQSMAEAIAKLKALGFDPIIVTP